jgi:hypothetical protein
MTCRVDGWLWRRRLDSAQCSDVDEGAYSKLLDGLVRESAELIGPVLARLAGTVVGAIGRGDDIGQ